MRARLSDWSRGDFKQSTSRGTKLKCRFYARSAAESPAGSGKALLLIDSTQNNRLAKPEGEKSQWHDSEKNSGQETCRIILADDPTLVDTFKASFSHTLTWGRCRGDTTRQDAPALEPEVIVLELAANYERIECRQRLKSVAPGKLIYRQ